MPSRWWGSAVGAAMVATVTSSALAGCSDGDGDGAGTGPTLPPIVTTSTSSTTLVTATTLPQYYEVQRGDTLTEIAVAYGLPVQAIMSLNGLADPNDLQAGQILQLPPRDIVATQLPPTAPGQTAPTLPGETSTTLPGAIPTTAPGEPPTTLVAPSTLVGPTTIV